MDAEKSNTDSTELQNAVLNFQYETQHFGYHPRTFLDLVYNVFFENASSSLTQMGKYMIEEFKEVYPPNLIKSQVDVLLQEVLKALDKSIDKLEVFLNKNVFSIDKHVILPEDYVHIKNPCTKEDDEKIDAEIKELKQKILVEKAKRFSLKKKATEQKEVKEKLLCLKNELECVLGIAYHQGVTPENISLLYSDFAKLFDFILPPL